MDPIWIVLIVVAVIAVFLIFTYNGLVRLRNRIEVTLDVDADHRLAPESHGERVGDGDDLHDALVEQLLHALAHGRLGQAHGLADGCVGTATVLLQLLDDRQGHSIDRRGRLSVPGICASTDHDLTVHEESSVPQDGIDEIRCLATAISLIS